MLIRPEESRDHDAVRAITTESFDSDGEARLVDALRKQASPLVSLVGEDSGEIVGHIMCSPVTLDGTAGLNLMGLAPMCVRESNQRQGIGARLVGAALDACRQLGTQAIVVLGHPEYYPRFGFVPASRFGITCEYDVPDDVFMAQELLPGALSGASGCIRYHAAFGTL